MKLPPLYAKPVEGMNSYNLTWLATNLWRGSLVHLTLEVRNRCRLARFPGVLDRRVIASVRRVDMRVSVNYHLIPLEV